MKKKFLNYLLPLLFLLFNFFLKGLHLDYQPVSGDETWSIFFAQYDIPTIINHLTIGNNPPLFEVILHYWINIFGIGEKYLRLLPMIFSSLAVYFIYKTGYKFFGKKAGIFAATLFTLSCYQMYYAHEVRVYSLFMLLSATSMYAYLNLIIDPKNRKYASLLVISNILLIYSHYLSFFILFVQGISIFILNGKKVNFLKYYLIYSGVVLVSYLPMFPTFFSRTFSSASEGTWIRPVTNLGQLTDVFFYLLNSGKLNISLFFLFSWVLVQHFLNKRLENTLIRYAFSLAGLFFLFFFLSFYIQLPLFWKFTSEKWMMILCLIFVIFVLGLAIFTKGKSPYLKILLLWLFIPLLIMFVSSFNIPMFISRYWIFITPAFFLIFGIGITTLGKFSYFGFRPPESYLTYIVLGVFVILYAINFELDIDKKRDVKSLVDKIKQVKTQKTLLYISPDFFDLTFTYHYNREYFQKISKTGDLRQELRKALRSESIFPISNFSEIDTSALKHSEKVVHLDALTSFLFPNNNIKPFLVNYFGDPEVYEFPEIFKVYEYRDGIKRQTK